MLIKDPQFIRQSSVFIAHNLLKSLKENKDCASIYEVTTSVKKYLPNLSYKQLVFGIIFLYILEIIDMDGLNLRIINHYVL